MSRWSGPQTFLGWGGVVKVVFRGVPPRWLHGRTVTPACRYAPSGGAPGFSCGDGGCD